MAISLDDVAECSRMLAEKSKSFSLASRFLDRKTHDAVAVTYAFLRYVDDAIDLTPREQRSSTLDHLRSDIAAAFAGACTGNSNVDRFAQLAREYEIPKVYVAELIAGMQMDVDRANYRTADDLQLYAFRVAGVVGLMLCHVMGLRDHEALPTAAHLGIAMQITNICRDVDEDFRDGRVYLPRSFLGFELTNVDASSRAEVTRAVRKLLAFANRFYASADAGIDELPFFSALAVRAARYIYAAIGDRLLLLGGDPFVGRAVVSNFRKAILLFKAMVVTCARAHRSRGKRSAPRSALTFADIRMLESERSIGLAAAEARSPAMFSASRDL